MARHDQIWINETVCIRLEQRAPVGGNRASGLHPAAFGDESIVVIADRDVRYEMAASIVMKYETT